jgi:hypothetical protein
MTMQAQAPASPPGGTPEPTTDLVREALVEARELVRLEVALAREDVTSKLAAAKRSCIAFGVAAAAALMALTLFAVAIVLAVPVPWAGALVVGGALVILAAALSALGWGLRPKQVFDKTKGRLESGFEEAKERLK